MLRVMFGFCLYCVCVAAKPPMACLSAAIKKTSDLAVTQTKRVCTGYVSLGYDPTNFGLQLCRTVCMCGLMSM